MRPHLRQPLRWGLIILLIVGSLGAATGSTRRASAQGDVLLDEAFKDNSNDWGLGSDKNGTVVLADGALTIETIVPSWIQWSYPGIDLPFDVDATATVQAVNPDKGNGWYYGLGVRGQTVGKSYGFYYLDVVGDGVWDFTADLGDGNPITLTSGKLKGFKPDAVTTLRIVAVGSHFDLYINDAKVGEGDDTTLESVDASQVLLIGGTSGKTTSQLVKFTSLKVVKPEKTAGGSAEPTATAEAPVLGGLPFNETFADSSNPNNWGLFSDDIGTVAIADGFLTIETIQAKQNTWSSPDYSFPPDVDASVVAQAVKPDKNGDWYFGIGIRQRKVGALFQDYYFQLDGHGNWELGVDLKTSKKIKSGVLKDFSPDAATTLRIVAVGKHFDLYIDGIQVGQADDTSLEAVDANWIALFNGTYTKTSRQLVKFTDLNVVAP